ncbi:hypothetical protein GGR50DRAFT_674797, partial [Xylaria sp. CBS 124048]
MGISPLPFAFLRTRCKRPFCLSSVVFFLSTVADSLQLPLSNAILLTRFIPTRYTAWRWGKREAGLFFFFFFNSVSIGWKRNEYVYIYISISLLCWGCWEWRGHIGLYAKSVKYL